MNTETVGWHGQADSPAPGRGEAALDLGEPDLAAGSGEAEVAGQRELEAAANAGADDG